MPVATIGWFFSQLINNPEVSVYDAVHTVNRISLDAPRSLAHPVLVYIDELDQP